MELTNRVEPREIRRLTALRRGLTSSERLLLVSDYLSPRTREVLRTANVSYFDTTGNVWLSNDSLLVERSGSGKPPRNGEEKRLRASLRGPITARIVRFLCDRRPPFKVRQIALDTDVNAGNVSRILEFLDREHFVQRSESGSVVDVDWEALLERWSIDLKKDRRAESFLDPHGLQNVIHGLIRWDKPYAITGPFASSRLAPAAVPLTIDIYVNDIEESRSELFLHRSDRIGNVRLIEAFDRVVFERTMTVDEMVLAAPTQIAADLLTLPVRSPDERSALIAWMKEHEPLWRR